jgi:hypothetical protein
MEERLGVAGEFGLSDEALARRFAAYTQRFREFLD